jgi:UDP-3-O-[3-hydroxymyristoyl] glucosamine N-acyltransferase
MTFSAPISIQTLATTIGATAILGKTDAMALGINEIHHVRVGDITFSDVQKYFAKALKSAATILILNESVAEIPDGKTILVHPKPFEAYDQIVRLHRPFTPLSTGVLAGGNLVASSATIHPTAILEANVVIGNHVTIGANTYIQANAVIHDHCVIGENCQIGAGVLIGTDAFYFKKTSEGMQKWRSGGRVVIENNVDIGAGTTINKGVSSDTVIGAGTKIDCQVHIGHDAKIGKNCLIAAQAGVSGNSVLEDDVVLYGQVGIAQNLCIGKGAVVLAKSGVSKNLEGGKAYFGYPAQEATEAYKDLANLRRLKKKD